MRWYPRNRVRRLTFITGNGSRACPRAVEMNAAGADWQLIMYGSALHGFTHAHAAGAPVPGVAYHPVADSRSFAAVRGFLADAFVPAG